MPPPSGISLAPTTMPWQPWIPRHGRRPRDLEAGTRADARRGPAARQGVGGQPLAAQTRATKTPRPVGVLPFERTSDKSVELRGFEPLTFCMPCSMVSSDSVALGPVTAVQSSFSVRGRLARSGGIWGHTGRPSARCPWCRSFSGGPRSEPDWHLSVHPALQRCSRAVRGWLPPAACPQDSRHRFGVLHYAYLPASGILHRLAPFALRAAFPPSLAGRYSRDYYGASVTVGLASGR